jgi:hypothetical protein
VSSHQTPVTIAIVVHDRSHTIRARMDNVVPQCCRSIRNVLKQKQAPAERLGVALTVPARRSLHQFGNSIDESIAHRLAPVAVPTVAGEPDRRTEGKGIGSSGLCKPAGLNHAATQLLAKYTRWGQTAGRKGRLHPCQINAGSRGVRVCLRTRENKLQSPPLRALMLCIRARL